MLVDDRGVGGVTSERGIVSARRFETPTEERLPSFFPCASTPHSSAMPTDYSELVSLIFTLPTIQARVQMSRYHIRSTNELDRTRLERSLEIYSPKHAHHVSAQNAQDF